MHYLFSLVLKSKDLSKAGDLFTLPDSSIMDDISEILERIKEIASGSSYIDNENDQSVVEICIARLTATLRDSDCIEEHIDALVDLLKTSLNHDLKPLAQETDPPHAKIASDVLACIFLNYSKRNVMKQALPVAVKFLHKGNKELSRSVSSYLPLAAIEHPELLASHIQPIIDSVIGGNYPLARLLPQIYSLNPERINEHVMALANLLSHCDDSEKCSLLGLFKLVAARNGSNRSLVLQPSLPQLLHCLNNPMTVGPTLEVLLEMSSDAKLLENHLDKIQESVARSANVGSGGSGNGGSGIGSNSSSNGSAATKNVSSGGGAAQNALIAAQIFRHVIQSCATGSSARKDRCRQILLHRMIKLLEVSNKDQSAQLQILREILSLAHHSPWLITSDVMFGISKSVNLSSSNFCGVGHAALNKLWDLCDGSGTPTGSSSAELLQTMSTPPQHLGGSSSTSPSKMATTITPPLSTGKTTRNYSILDGSTDKLINNPLALSVPRLANFSIPSTSTNKQQPLQQPLHQQQQLPIGGGNNVIGAGLHVPSFSTYIPHTPSSAAAIHPIGLPTTISINSCRSPTNNGNNFSSIEYRKRGAGGGINITIPPVTAYQNRSASSISGLREDFGTHLNSLRTSQSSMTPSVAGSTNASSSAVVVPPPPHDLAWTATGIRSPTKTHGHHGQHHNLIGNSGTFSSSAASILSGHGISSTNNFVSRLSTNQLAGSGFNNNNISYSIYLSNNNYNITSNSGFLTGKTNPTGSSSHYNNYNAQHHYGGGGNSSGGGGHHTTKLQNGHHHQKMQPLSPTSDAHHQLVNSVMSQPDLRMNNQKELQVNNGRVPGLPVDGGMSHMSLIQSSSGENHVSGNENNLGSSPTNHQSSPMPLAQISVFEPFPMRDVVQHFCEKHLEKIKSYMEKITVRIPLPVKCTIEERKSRKNAKLHFACQFQTEHCIYSGTRLFSMKTRYPRVWIHLMFLALQARSTSQALSTRESSVSSLKNCWEILKCENKTFLTIVTSAFPSTRDQDCLLLELRNAGFFDLFEFNALKAQWGCFFCNHPGRALQFLTSEQPIMEGCLKEKKGKWKLFKRWRTRYFTLSGGQLMARGNDSTSTLNLHQILSVRVTRGQRQIPKAFEIFTQDKKVVLKPKDGKNANEWVQCLSVLVARNEAGGGPGSDSLSTGFNSCYPSQIHLSKAVSVNGFRTEV